ncbi:MAG: hypothetical protein KJZ78_12070, partial [Bryobacteraceae bacterium]|nr:hypothetical protein [Bryobacteraceae bacterium]
TALPGTVAFFVVGVSLCIAQETKPGPDYEQLKALEWLIGDWEANWVIPAEGYPVPDEYAPGAKVRSTGSFYWMQNKNYIGYRFRDEVDGKLGHQGFEMIGVDPQSKKIIHWLFSIMGGWGTAEWTLDGKTWKLKWSGTIADGTTFAGVSYHVPIDADAFTWQMKQNTKNGKSMPDTPLITFHRRKPGPPAGDATAKDYIAMQQNYFAGEWNIEVIGGEGAGSTGTWTCRLDASGTSFHETATMNGKPFLHAIAGYDPHLNAFKEVAFYVDGSTATLIYRHPLKAIQGNLVGKVLRGTMERISADGKKEALVVLANPVEPHKSLLTIHKQGNPKDIVVKAVYLRKQE